MEITIKSTDDIDRAAQQFVDAMQGRTVYALHGNMGAGKTTLTKAVCKALGVTDEVNSPTFAIINEYAASDGAIYHFDFYRVNDLREAVDIGCEEYFYSGRPCFIEWPELVEPLLPEGTVTVTVEEQPDGSRLVTMD